MSPWTNFNYSHPYIGVEVVGNESCISNFWKLKKQFSLFVLSWSKRNLIRLGEFPVECYVKLALSELCTKIKNVKGINEVKKHSSLYLL